MKNPTFKKETFKKELKEALKVLSRKTLEDATPHQIYQAVCYVVKDVIIDNWMKTQKQMDIDDPKIVYYMSMEFLTGRYLGNNLLDLTAYDEVKEALQELNIDLNAIEDEERDPALGNGGLGRLAACFMDSLSTLGYAAYGCGIRYHYGMFRQKIEDEERDPALGNGGLGRLAACFMDSLSTLGYAAYGCGIRYHYGMFRQKIEDGRQVEEPDNWLSDGSYPFELKRPEYAKEIKFGGYVTSTYDEKTGRSFFKQEGYQSVLAVPYDLPILGYDNNVVNTLRIWDAEAINDFELASFDKGDYYKAVEQENLARTICSVLYPNDNHMSGKELRLKQQYFFVSATLQAATAKYMRMHKDIHKLYEKVTFHMNDTHPTLAVAELMRLLLDEYNLTWEEAWAVTTKCCAYTNHTIMSEALEKWPLELFSRLLPRIYQIVEEINRRFCHQIREHYPQNSEEKIRSMAVVYDGMVRMANLAIVGGYSVNGVAALHTEILKQRELRDFYEMMPEKFSNKTNGITQRRFLLHGNPLLADWVTAHIGKEWITDLSKNEGLAIYADDKKAQAEFMNIKYQNKVRLANYILEHNGIEVNPRSIFDVQVKRLHEYKRQLLNIMHVMYLYNQIKEHPEMEFYPRTFIFG
ncbi:MAG: glycogen/starch/alpha-glucan family phosphorylase, partial [Eubacterium sp.]|nr:glycogen/starch/alpha-glucan family phosphorylase [Eubacterium sp.]